MTPPKAEAVTTTNPFAVTSHQMLKVLARLRDIHRDMTLLQAMCFFQIALNPGISQRKLSDSLASNDSVASRTIAILSELGARQGKSETKALHLVEMRVNPQDRRERLMYLTAKGRRLLEDIMNDMNAVSANQKERFEHAS